MNEDVSKLVVMKKLERAILLSADKEGRISIPPGTAMHIDVYVTILCRLQATGVVNRDAKAPYYSPFSLTEKGKALRLAMQQAAESTSAS